MQGFIANRGSIDKVWEDLSETSICVQQEIGKISKDLT